MSIAAVLVLSVASGCSILPGQRSEIAFVVPLKAVHDAAEATAALAPASAETPYNNLRRDFNDFISRQEAIITSVGETMALSSKVGLADTSIAADAKIRKDIAEFAAAAPTARSESVLSSAMSSADVLVMKIYPEVDAIRDSRSNQAKLFNQELEKLKLDPWETVNRPSTGTR